MNKINHIAIGALAALLLTTAAAQAQVIIQIPKEMVEKAKKKPKLTFPKEMIEAAQNQGKSKVGSKADRAEDVVIGLDCVVIGSPAALMLTNRSTVALGEGTTIKWQVEGLRLQGYLALNSALPPGQVVKAAGPVEALPAGADCTAKLHRP